MAFVYLPHVSLPPIHRAYFRAFPETVEDLTALFFQKRSRLSKEVFRMPDPKNVESVVRREHDAMIAETRIAQCPPFVAVSNMSVVERYPTSLRWNHPAMITALARAKASAYVVECASLNSICLWVATASSSYRDDYLLFLKSVHGLDLASIPRAYDVDHLYNRSRAQIYMLQYIRVALVKGAANRSHGSAYEKDLTINEAARTAKEIKLMDEISMMKYFGYLSPLRDNPRAIEVRAYANFAASQMGLDAAEICKSVGYLRQKASTPWARK
jgi:hypothetical protein